MRRAYGTSFLVLFVSLVSGVLFAQSDLGTISGFIKDPSGASIPKASVLIRNQTGVERQTTTNEAGYYTITSIPSGLYSVTVEAPGFQRSEERRVGREC